MTIHSVGAEIGQWYLRNANGERFRVVGIDDRTYTIEIQSSEGDLDELDIEAWNTLRLTRCPDPEGWACPMDGFDECDSCELTGQPLSHREVLEFLQTESRGN